MTHFLIILIGLWLAQAATAATLYVSTNGATPDPGNKYPTWATAATNIQDAVFAATNDVVLVTNGVYTCASSVSGGLRSMIVVTNSVTLQSVNGPAVTIVNGGNTGTFSNRCFYINNANAVVSGFTITNGNGGGVYIKTSGTVTNCWITGNTNGYGVALDSGGLLQNSLIAWNISPLYAGGVGCAGGGRVQDCVISNNWCLGLGGGGGAGGIYLYGSASVTAANCRIMMNRSEGCAGGAWARNYGTFLNCTIISNYASGIASGNGKGGGIYLNNATARNCLVAKNVGVSGGGIYIYGNTGWVENCTIVSNKATTSGTGGGIGLDASARIQLLNSIVYSNLCAGSNDNWLTNNTSGSFTNCCTTPTNENMIGVNNITNWPLLMDFRAENYRLTNASPCINAGTNQDWMIGAKDLDGRNRLDGFTGLVDIGAYEYLPKGTVVSIQ